MSVLFFPSKLGLNFTFIKVLAWFFLLIYILTFSFLVTEGELSTETEVHLIAAWQNILGDDIMIVVSLVIT